MEPNDRRSLALIAGALRVRPCPAVFESPNPPSSSRGRPTGVGCAMRIAPCPC